MSYDNYSIKLNDGREDIIIPANLTNLYPAIQEQVDYLYGNELALAYPDSQALRIVLTTDFLKQGYSPDMYIRLINAMSYLGNEDIVNTMLKTIVNWFDTPNILAQLKQNKDVVKNLMGTLAVPVLWQILQFLPFLHLAYKKFFHHEFIINATSNDLNYIVISGYSGRSEILYEGKEIGDLDNTTHRPNTAIKDNGDVYYLYRPMEGPSQIMKLIGTEIKATKDENVISHPLAIMRQDKAVDLFISQDGTKFRTLAASPTDKNIQQFEVRNIDTNNLIFSADHHRDQKEYNVSPRINYAIEIEIDEDTEIYTQYHLINMNGQRLTVDISLPEGLTYNNLTNLFIQNYVIDFDPRRQLAKRLSPTYTKLIFSYSENIFIEVIDVPTHIPDSKFLKAPDEPIIQRHIHYMVRILDTNGNVLVDRFITNEEPIGISDTMFLTPVKRGQIYTDHRGNKTTLQDEYVLVRYLNNIQGPILQEINPPDHIQKLFEGGGRRLISAFGTVNVLGVIPGDKNSFMIMHSPFDPDNPGHIGQRGKSNLQVAKYTAEGRYENMEQFLDEKLED